MPNVTIAPNDFEMRVIPDETADASYLDQEGWEDRKVQYERGDFDFVGVRAVATLRIPHGCDYIDSKVESPGLWGIESDSDDEYVRSVYDEEVQLLTDMLNDLNVTVTD
jgi:hypothetical protein